MADVRSRRSQLLERAALVAAVAVSGLLMVQAARAHGMAFPSFVVDPWCRQSTVRLPSWPASVVPAGARVVAVDGAPLHGPGCAQSLYARADQALTAGATTLALTVEHDGARSTVDAPLRRMGALGIAFFFGLYLVAAWLVLLSGIGVLRIAGAREAARAYFFWSCGAFLFLAALFAFHTRPAFAGLFSLGTAWVPAGWLWLAWAFPNPPASGPRTLRAATRVACAALMAVGVAIVVGEWAGLDTGRLQRAVPVAAAGALVILAASVFIRLRRAQGRARNELKAAAWGFVVAPAGAALLVVGAMLGDTAFHLAAPFLIIALPASLGWALVRHNILGSAQVVRASTLWAPLALVSALIAGFAAILIRLSAPAAPVTPSLFVGASAFALVFWPGRALLRRLLFPSALRFRPSVQKLGDTVAALQDRAAIRSELQRAVSAAVGVGDVAVLGRRELQELAAKEQAQLAAGQRVWRQAETETRLWVPLRSMSELRGAIRLGTKDDGALFTSEDLELLETLAAVGALALHNAEVVAEIDARRALQLKASRLEKELALGVVGAEISHEISYALNFFRYLLRRTAPGQALEREDLEIAREEVERLERMVASLRRLAPPAPAREEVVVKEVAQRAVRLLQQDVEANGTRVELDVPETCRLDASADAVLQLIANLLRNAIQAAGSKGAAGVRAGDRDGAWEIDVWDSGPGVPAEVEPVLFDPWSSSRSGGNGLGMGISLRIARSYGWTLTHVRLEGRTVFRIRTAGRAQPASAREAS